MSRIFVRGLKPYEGKKLVRLLRHGKDAIAVRRAEIVLASAQGESAREIAGRLYFTDDYVRKVIHRFNKDGLEVLKANYINGGRPKKVFPEHESELVELALTPPNLTGQPFTQWSLETLREVAILRGLIPKVCLETVRQILKDYHISLQRTKTWKESSDPDFEVKKTPSKRSTARRKKAASK